MIEDRDDPQVSTVRDLLEQSKAQHRNYQHEARTPTPNYAICAGFIAQALSLRTQADDLDPNHIAPAWTADEERWPHEALLDFYRGYPDLPALGVRRRLHQTKGQRADL